MKKPMPKKAPAKSSGHMRDKPTNPIKVDMGKLGKKVC